MTRSNSTGMIPVRDPIQVMLEPVEALAVSVLKDYSDEAGLCVMYGSLWPCERVCGRCAQLCRDLTALLRQAGLATLAPRSPSPVLPSIV